MGTQPTGGGSTTSFTNTPQAKDDSYLLGEDALLLDQRYNIATSTLTLDVMSNDLGGSAKSLFSVYEGDGDLIDDDFELLSKDVDATGASPWERTLEGNWVRINNGKIEYRIAVEGSDDPEEALPIDALPQSSEPFTDQFVYAIRLSNGTLSEAIVKIEITGSNDGPTVVVEIADDSTDEDALYSYDASANFEDVDLGDTLSYSATLAGGGALPAWLTIDPDTGVLSGTPENGDVGVYTIVVTATDDAGETASSEYVLTVDNVNDAPVVTVEIADASTDEDAAYSYDASANFADDDTLHGDTLSYSATLAGGGALPAWLTIDPDTGVLSGTPENGDVGVYTIVVTATDDAGETASSEYVLTVDNVNDAPVVTVEIADASTDEDAAYSYDASANFADDDTLHGDTLSYSATLAGGGALPAWLTIDPDTGVLSGTPENGDVGVYTIVVTATDDAGETASSEYVLTVDNVNDAPVVTVEIADASTDEDAAYSYDASANFADDDTLHGDTLSYSATLAGGGALPAWLTIDPDTGVLSGTPENGDVGVYTIVVTATDDAGETASSEYVLTVDNVNDAPVVTVEIADASTDEDAAYSYDASANFADDDTLHGDTLSYSATLAGGGALPAWLTIDPDTGVLSGTPENGDVGVYTIVVTATDDAGETASSEYVLTVDNVNDAPVVTVEIADASTDEDAAYSYDASANFADDDTLHGDTLSYSATLAGGGALPAWLTIDPDTGVLSGTPENGDVGVYTIVVTATDDAGETASSEYVLTVDNVNDAPVVTVEIADASTDEDAAYSYDASANFADDDTLHGDTLSYSATLAGGGALPAWLTIDPDTGVLSGTPENGDVGVYTIVVTATDDAGETASSEYVLTVDNVNDAPVVTVEIADASTDEDAAYSYDASANFADDDTLHGDTLSYSATLAGGGALPAWLTIDPDTGVLSGTPENGDVGVYTIVVTATDDAGETASSEYVLTVDNVNDAPVVTVEIADASTDEDAAYSYDASANFADDDTLHGDTLSYSATLAGGGALPAWLTIDPDTGVLSGTPENGDVGVYTIVVTATDDAGETASSEYVLTVDNVNDAPVVTVEIADASTDEDAAYSYDASANFADDDTLHGDTLSYSATLAGGGALPAWLTIDPDTGVLSGTPENGDVGVYTIVVTATDDAGETASSEYVLTVDNVNDAPVVTVEIADASTDEDAAYSYDASANFADDDTLHGDTLSYSATLAGGGALPAWLTIDPDTGVLSGTPENGDVGVYTIVVTATDDAGETASSEYVLTVDNVNDAPVNAVPGAQTATAGTSTAIAGVSVNDVDSASVTTTLSVLHGVVSVTTGGGATIGGNGTGSVTVSGTLAQVNAAIAGLSYTATSGYSGSDTLTVNTSDGSLSDVDGVAITVTAPANAAPTDIKFSLDETSANSQGSSLGSGDPLGTFTAIDPDSSSWTFTLSGADANLFAINAATGVLSVGGSNIGSGTYTITITAQDGSGNISAPETYTVWVGSTGPDGTAAVPILISSGSDIDFALNGNDIISGGMGDDALVGGQNNDTLNGGLGTDELLGGGNNDNFVFQFDGTTTSLPLYGVDRILDMNASGNDTIHLDDALFAGITNATLASTVVFGAAAGDANDRIIYNSVTGGLYYDADGNGSGAAVQFAQLDPGTVLAISDFLVI